MQTNPDSNQRENSPSSSIEMSAPSQSSIDSSRRRLAGFGLGVPVIMSLASRPVMGAQCLSNMMSGNLSDPDRGLCVEGNSPGGWGQPGGTVAGGVKDPVAWTAIGFSLTSTIAQVTANGLYVPGSVPSTATLGQVLNSDLHPAYDKDAWMLARATVNAYLNALAGSAFGSSFQYVLTPQQVIDLSDGTIPVPAGYTSLKDFFHSTWE